jgi:beta-lactamase class D
MSIRRSWLERQIDWMKGSLTAEWSFCVPCFHRPVLMRIALLVTLGTVIAANAHAAIVCTAIADAVSGLLRTQEGTCDIRVTPASTFKIAIGLMGYDSGYLRDEHSPRLAFLKGDPDWNPSWRQPTDPTSWIKNSVVWYSQRVTRHLGERRFQQYVTRFRYGNEDVSGDPGQRNGLTHAWLGSSLQISPLEQLQFLEQIVQRRLGVTARAYDMVGRITRIAPASGGWEVHGKTGTGFPVLPDRSTDEDHAFGWFVGWASKGSRSVVFARLIQDTEAESTPAGLRARDAFMKELPGILEASEAHDGNR